ncbi:hypothetical protein P4S80_07380, partial [Aeribacillus composti]|uniref:hypothetical protein n=1 Tax=Aeribacillus composti TaxID=1868734 RepID=UPI002E2330D1|nr:hypothetical protein [Aeribacillus composti]
LLNYSNLYNAFFSQGLILKKLIQGRQIFFLGQLFYELAMHQRYSIHSVIVDIVSTITKTPEKPIHRVFKIMNLNE